MADASSSPDAGLKYLGFFRTAVIKAVALVTTIYEYAKESSGVLKPGLDRVEGTVKTVTGPVYSKLEGKPDELLFFVDSKVDALLKFVDAHTPGHVKEKGSQVVQYAKCTHGQTKAVYVEVREKGVFEVSKSYVPVLQDYAYGVWKFSLKFPLVPQLAMLFSPPILFSLGTYNSVAGYMKTNSFSLLKTVGFYLPIVPVEKVEKTVKEDTAGALKQKKVE